jgi:hypothetical protein
MIHDITAIAGRTRTASASAAASAPAAASRPAAATRAPAPAPGTSQSRFLRGWPDAVLPAHAQVRLHQRQVQDRVLDRQPRRHPRPPRLRQGRHGQRRDAHQGRPHPRRLRDLKILGDLGPRSGPSRSSSMSPPTASPTARKLVEDAGGKVNETGTRRDNVRGVDRNSDDRPPRTSPRSSSAGLAQGQEAAARGEVLKKKN